MQHFRSKFTWCNRYCSSITSMFGAKVCIKRLPSCSIPHPTCPSLQTSSMSSFSWSETIASLRTTKDPIAMTCKSLCFGADDLPCTRMNQDQQRMKIIYFVFTFIGRATIYVFTVYTLTCVYMLVQHCLILIHLHMVFVTFFQFPRPSSLSVSSRGI